MNANALVDLVNRQLDQHGTAFVLSREMPLGPLGMSLFGSIRGLPARIDFIVNPADDRRSVVLYDLRSRESAAERPAASNFQDAVAEYPWSAAIAALTLL